MKNGKDIRMFHGTKVLHWQSIKKDGIKAIGKGVLGEGFYFTPSVPIGMFYCFRSHGTHTKDRLQPVLVELIIKDADKLIVGDFSKDRHKYPIQTTSSKFSVWEEGFWQFIVRSKEILNKHFQIERVFRLNM